MVSPELLNFHLKDLAGGSASTSQVTKSSSPRAAPIAIGPKFLQIGVSEHKHALN